MEPANVSYRHSRDICDGGFPAGFGCPSGHFYSNGCCYLRSDWYYYGRWAVAGAIVVFFILLLLLIG